MDVFENSDCADQRAAFATAIQDMGQFARPEW